jgi:hypothetical protein
MKHKSSREGTEQHVQIEEPGTENFNRKLGEVAEKRK